jgi:hypothetical protein
LAGGNEIFLGVIVVLVIAVIYGLYTRTGSGIDQHPYRHIWGGAPGAAHDSELSGSDPVAQDAQRVARGVKRRRQRREPPNGF